MQTFNLFNPNESWTYRQRRMWLSTTVWALIFSGGGKYCSLQHYKAIRSIFLFIYLFIQFISSQLERVKTISTKLTQYLVLLILVGVFGLPPSPSVPKCDAFPQSSWACSCTVCYSVNKVSLVLHIRTTRLARAQLGCKLGFPHTSSARQPNSDVFDEVAICFHKGSISYSFPFLVGQVFLSR